MSDLWHLLGGQWDRSLAARNRAPKTRENYAESYGLLADWAGRHGKDSPTDIAKADLEDFFAGLFRTPTRFNRPATPGGVARHYRHLKVFFGWLSAAEDLPNPMGQLAPPTVPEQLVPVLTDDQLRALLGACRCPHKQHPKQTEGQRAAADACTFSARRDLAIIRLFLDAGIRRAEMAGIQVNKLDLDEQVVTVLGKGRRERLVPYGNRTAEAIDTYLRARARHRDRGLPDLWLAAHPHRGPLGIDGLRQMLNRRASQAGVPDVHPHRFRHTAASSQLEAGLSEGDAMRLFGWKTRAMVDRYGASVAHKRAIKAARRTSHADRI